jgi:hypothetical protein
MTTGGPEINGIIDRQAAALAAVERGLALLVAAEEWASARAGELEAALARGTDGTVQELEKTGEAARRALRPRPRRAGRRRPRRPCPRRPAGVRRGAAPRAAPDPKARPWTSAPAAPACRPCWGGSTGSWPRPSGFGTSWIQ